MPKQKTDLQLLEMVDVDGDSMFRLVADAPENFLTLEAARSWVKANRNTPCTYYPVRVGSPIVLSIESVKRVS